MSTATIQLDRELVQRSFREWQAEQEALDSQLSESMAALEAYQSHLDNWQLQLAQEREDLQRMREELGRERPSDGKDHEKLARCEQELLEARAKITSLTAALLDRTEELRQLDRGRAETNAALAAAKARERDLSAAHESLQKSTDVQRGQLEGAIAEMRRQLDQSPDVVDAPAPAELRAGDPPLGPTATGSPVLSSLMEQFNKLRQQRSLGRHSPTRTR
jgi:chromosome segregation ATPase